MNTPLIVVCSDIHRTVLGLLTGSPLAAAVVEEGAARAAAAIQSGERPVVVDPSLCAEEAVARALADAEDTSPVYALSAHGYADSLQVVRDAVRAGMGPEGVLRLTYRVDPDSGQTGFNRTLAEAFCFLTAVFGGFTSVRALVPAGPSMSPDGVRREGQQMLAIICMHARTLVHLDCSNRAGHATLDRWEYAAPGALFTWDEMENSYARSGLESGSNRGNLFSGQLGRSFPVRDALQSVTARMTGAHGSDTVTLRGAAQAFAAAMESATCGEVVRI